MSWVHFVVEGLVLGIVCLIGTATNSIASYVLLTSSLDLSPIFVRVVVALMSYDTTFLLGCLAIFVLPSVFPSSYGAVVYPHAVPYLLPVVQIALTGSVYMTMCVSIERYLAIRFSVNHLMKSGRKASELKPRRALLYILPIILFSGLYNVTRFFELETYHGWYLKNVTTQEKIANLSVLDGASATGEIVILTIEEKNLTFTSVRPTPMRSDPRYVRDYLLLTNLLFMALIPLAVLVSVNSMLYNLISRHNSLLTTTRAARRDRTIARMFIKIVVAFIISHSLRLVLTLYEVVKLLADGKQQSWPDWSRDLSTLNHLFLATNSSTNFIIYCWKDKKFRAAIIQQIFPKRVRRALTGLERRQTSRRRLAAGEGGGSEGASPALAGGGPRCRNANGNEESLNFRDSILPGDRHNTQRLDAKCTNKREEETVEQIPATNQNLSKTPDDDNDDNDGYLETDL